MKFRMCAIALLAASIFSQQPVWGQQGVPPEILAYPNMVLYNGQVLTADDNFTIAEAVAIRDGKFLAVGRTDQILRMAGPQTRKVDLQRKSVTPGFIETHAHSWSGNVGTSASRNSADVSPGYDYPGIMFKTHDEALQMVKEMVAKFPAGKWIWTSTIRSRASLSLTAQQLDTVSLNNPVTITISPQEAVLNSKALDLLINGSPVVSMGGGVMTGSDGKPDGQIRGNAFGTLFYEFFPWTDLAPMIEDQKRQLQRNVATGITTRIGRMQGLAVTILNELHTRGELPLRVRFAHEFLRMLPDAERFFKRMGNMVGMGDDMFKIIGTVEQQIDGGSRVGAILTKAPKLRVMEGAAYGMYGANYWGEDQGYPAGKSPRDNIVMAGKYGWPVVSLHSYGDKVIELELDAFEEGMKQWPPALTKHHWVLDHNWMHDADTIAKAKELGVQISTLLWFTMGLEQTGGEENPVEGEAAAFGMTDDPLIYMYGMEGLQKWSPVKTLIDAGIRPYAETSRDPLENIEAFITRKDRRGRVWGRNEAVDRKTALWMKTNWAAAYTEEQDKIGTIEVGKFADLVVLGGDYMTVPEEEISELGVLMTVVGGKVVFEQAGKL